MNWGKDDDAFDPKAVREGRRIHNASEHSQYGGRSTCCGRRVPDGTMAGCICPRCGKDVRLVLYPGEAGYENMETWCRERGS